MDFLTNRRRLLLGAAGFLAAMPAGAAEGRPVTWLTPADRDYDAARRLFNSALSLRPAVIAQCRSEQGVLQAVARAALEKKAVAVKSGGHSFEGFCLNDGGLVVDVSGMKAMNLDRRTGLLTAGPGCRLGELNQALLAKGRLLPSGSCGGVGLAGLVLGGGYGLFARQFGLTCDHLEGVRLVDGEGNVRDSRDEPELLWACRGGGNGQFGVVTEFRLRTHTSPARLHAFKFRAGQLTGERAMKLLEAWFEASAGLPDHAFSAFVMNGRFLTVLLTCTGSPEDRGVVGFRKRLVDRGTQDTRSRAVPLAQALPRYYGEPGPLPFKNASAGCYESFAQLAPALPGVFQEVLRTPGLIFQVNTLGGAIARGPDGAYPHRQCPWLGEWQAYWQRESQREPLLAAGSRLRGHLAAAGIRRHYANYPDLAFVDWAEAYYGDSLERLRAVKRRLDPADRIRHPQSLKA